MRRLTQYSKQYKVEFSPRAQAQLKQLPAGLTDEISEQLQSIAELVELAPIPQVGGLTDEREAPPLHLTVGEWVLTYVIERRARKIRVIELDLG